MEASGAIRKLPPNNKKRSKKMTRKHFELIAKIIAKCGGAPESEKYNINALLREQNSNFDSDRFWRAVEKELNKE